MLSNTTPTEGHIAIVTLNADEENATAHAALIAQDDYMEYIQIVSPNPQVTRTAVAFAARRLKREVPQNIHYAKLGYWRLLDAYRVSTETYSTHVLLPGVDRSNARRHVHLTHGSGLKPDTTFRGPTNVLSSITPQWVEQQLVEYKLPPTTEVIEYMPRLEIMRSSVGDQEILVRLGLASDKPLIVWAPTYRRSIQKREARVDGVPFSESADMVPIDVLNEAIKRRATLILKTHPHDADNYDRIEFPVFTNESLRNLEVTPYELFGVATLVITDYSSIFTERKKLGLECLIVQPDYERFAESARGIRNAV